jgi:kynurenine formamidase
MIPKHESGLDTAEHKLIDLSHTVSHGLVTYKGLPAPIICDFLSREQSRAHYAPWTEFQIGKIEMVANTGTYLDSPFHRYENGKDLSELELTSLANLDGKVLRAGDKVLPFGVPPLGGRADAELRTRAIQAHAFDGIQVNGKAILIHSGWDQHWQTETYFEGTHPFLTKDAAQYLADNGAALVGIDSYNIDDTADLSRPAHSILLRAGIPIVEHMCNLDQLPDEGFKFFAVPVKVKGMGTWPVRAFAIVE